MGNFGIFIVAAVFMIVRIAITNEKKRKKDEEQKARRMQQAYTASNMHPSHEPTSIERELHERSKPSPQEYGEGYSTWGTTPSGNLPPRNEAPQQTLRQGQSAWGTTPAGSLPPRNEAPQQTLRQGQSAWGTTPAGSLPPRNEEERNRREAAALAAERAEALRRERIERIARNKAMAQRGAPHSTEGTSAYGQEGVSVEGSSLNSGLQRHKLEASSITGHAHTESSMVRQADDCDDYAIRNAAMGQSGAPMPAMLQGLNFKNSDDVVKGFIFSEILAKPKALRR